MAKILIVEDDEALGTEAFLHLKSGGHTVQLARSLDEGLKQMRRMKPDIIFSDLMLGDASGMDLLKASRREPQLPDFILATAHPSGETAGDAMEHGAYEYLVKPYRMEEVSALLKRILERRELLAGRVERRIASGEAPDVIAACPAMMQVLDDLREAAPRDTTVLLRGESGTGKEQLARWLHHHGAHPDGPFVAINCGALPENLLASELFGHEAGAFTGATGRHAGAFERAGEGTLLLDEIGDIPPSTQVHLLRVLESREVIRVGGSETIPVRARLVAATHRNLEERVAGGEFRQDLYYRINVFPVVIPPLRERVEEIPELVRHFLAGLDAEADRFPDAAIARLQEYPWPGNVRELRNIVENLLIRARDGKVTPALAHAALAPLEGLHPDFNRGSGAETLAETEVRRIRDAIDRAGGNKSRAAALLGISRRKLYSRMKVLGIELDE